MILSHNKPTIRIHMSKSEGECVNSVRGFHDRMSFVSLQYRKILIVIERSEYKTLMQFRLYKNEIGPGALQSGIQKTRVLIE